MFNNNIGCIETDKTSLIECKTIEFNNNIGCIETAPNDLMELLNHAFNNNIGCIETEKRVEVLKEIKRLITT